MTDHKGGLSFRLLTLGQLSDHGSGGFSVGVPAKISIEMATIVML
jgi:hypothetical protein